MTRSGWIRHVLAIALPLAAVATCATLAVTARAASGPKLMPGPGVWIGGHSDFVGAYRAQFGARWVTVYCIDPDRPAPRAIALHTRVRVQGLSRAATRLLAETLTAHGDAATATQAEAVSQALNTEAGNLDAVTRRAHYLPRRVLDLAARYVAEAHRLHGPYALRLRLPIHPLPGQAGTGTVTLRAGDHGVAGNVALRHSPNVATPRAVRTDATGRREFGYRATGTGPVRITAAMRVAPTTVRASTTDGGTQVMVTWSPRARLTARTGYRITGPRFRHRYACTDVCDGTPQITLTACAPPSRYDARITYVYASRSHRVDFTAADHRACRSWRTPIADATRVRASWQFRTPSGWTSPISAAGTFTVDCPPAPPVAALLDYDCADATLVLALGRVQDGALVPWHNGTRRRMVLVVSGGLSGSYEVAPGASASAHRFTLTCGPSAPVTVAGGVQRADGSYNYGHPTTVVLP